MNHQVRLSDRQFNRNTFNASPGSFYGFRTQKIFSGKQQRQIIFKVKRFGKQLRLIAVMMDMELVSETLNFINHLTRLSARENFTEQL